MKSTTNPDPIPPSVWQAAHAAGVSYVVVQAWDGKSINGNADS